jgi:polyprenyldihydroxybenzoate methyltransferase / 3-demethylubiquinol 3-O-methyltransferase
LELIQPGGSIFVTTLNKTRLSYFGAILMAENVLNLVPKNSHDWNKFVEPHEVERMLKDNDCSTMLVNGMVYDIISNQWSWSKCKEINYAVHAVKT